MTRALPDKELKRWKYKLALWLLGNPDQERVTAVYVHTALAGQDIYDTETLQRCTETNNHHATEARRIAAELYDEYEQREYAEIMRDDEDGDA